MSSENGKKHAVDSGGSSSLFALDDHDDQHHEQQQRSNVLHEVGHATRKLASEMVARVGTAGAFSGSGGGGGDDSGGGGGALQITASGINTDGNATTSAEKQRRSIPRLWFLFRTLAMPYFRHDRAARWRLAFVVVLALLQSAVSICFSYTSRNFWNALSEKQMHDFRVASFRYFMLIVIAVPVITFYVYKRNVLCMEWRRWLTLRLSDEFFAERSFYRLENEGRAVVDNPDQRITEDAKSFTSTSVSLALNLLRCVIDLGSFSFILISIYPRLFGTLIIYASAGTIVSYFVGRRLIQLNFTQLQREADLRFALVRVRECAESIAFYRGERREKLVVESRLFHALENYAQLLIWTFKLDVFTTYYEYLIQILPIFLVAPVYFSGVIKLGALNQAWSAFNHVLDDLSWILREFDTLSEFSAGVDRLGEFVEFLEARIKPSDRIFLIDPNHAFSHPHHHHQHHRRRELQNMEQFDHDRTGDEDEDGDEEQDRRGLSALNSGVGEEFGKIALIEDAPEDTPLVLEQMTLFTPDDAARMLIRDLSFTLRRQERLMLVGESGRGKSSLLRALAGLWDRGDGVIHVSPGSKAMFLPQKPFCTIGSLTDQLLYPHTASDFDAADVSASRLDAVLTQVGLQGLAQRFDGYETVRDWADVLSNGEQQRLAFARLMLSYQHGHTTFALLDEASSALDARSEKRVYELLLASSLTYISVGHRLTLAQYHDRLLRLTGETDWQLEPITEEKREQAVASAMFQL